MVTVTRTAPRQGHFTGTCISGGLKNNVPRKVGLVLTVCAVAVARLEGRCLESTAQGTGSSVSPICPTCGQLLLPDTGNVVWNCKFTVDLPLWQELIEVSILHVLCYHAQWVISHAHPQKPDDIWVLQPWHDFDLFQEIISCKIENEGLSPKLFLGLKKAKAACKKVPDHRDFYTSAYSEFERWFWAFVQHLPLPQQTGLIQHFSLTSSVPTVSSLLTSCSLHKHSAPSEAFLLQSQQC